MTTPREILAFGPGEYTVKRTDFPWLEAVRVVARGGDGAAASDGTPGGPGTTEIAVLHGTDIPDVMRIVVGRGGRGRAGAVDGQDGFVLLEMYDEPAE